MITPQRVLELLEEHANVLLYGPPGTGKSHLMKEVQNLFEEKYSGGDDGVKVFIDTEKERDAFEETLSSAPNTRWVTFHQGYSYEDFIIGLRPSATNGGGASGSVLSLEVRAGAMLELAALAKHSRALMLIDEINRGNTSRIFGEFITLMEMDKRLMVDGQPSTRTVCITLPYIGSGQKVDITEDIEVQREFRMPRHVYTLASMNSVDKSVAPLDAAIRRRFYLCQLRPTDADWEEVAGVSGAMHPVASLAVEVMKKVNRGIGLYLGPDYMLGQYYLPSDPSLGSMNEADARTRMVSIWRHKILPQLVEFFQSRPGICMTILGIGEGDSDSGLKVVLPTDDEIESGASLYVLNDEAEMSDDAIYGYLERFAGTATRNAEG